MLHLRHLRVTRFCEAREEVMAALARATASFSRVSDHLLHSGITPRYSTVCFTHSAAVRWDPAIIAPALPNKFAKRLQSYSPTLERLAEPCLRASSSTLCRRKAVSISQESVVQIDHSIRDTGGPAIPLCERPASSIASLTDIFRWRHQAQELATSVGSEFLDADGGPDVGDLLRELEWLLDDAVVAYASCSEELSITSKMWKACGWRDIKEFRTPELDWDNLVSANISTENLSAFARDGAFGILCKERHTDPVNEFAADCGCFCDGIRESLTEMASNDEPSTDSEAAMRSISTVDPRLNMLDDDRCGVKLLLRMSINELESAWTERIQKRRPFQYVVGAAYWRDLVLGVGEGVLIPRPETEQIVDLVEQAIADNESLGRGLWADLGTGTGAIAISVARLLQPLGSVVAIDASSAAIAVSKINIERYSLQNRVKVLQGFWFSPLQDKQGELAGVTSNPPYIPSGSLSGLQAEVGKHEPRISLDGGPDGMNDLREICSGSVTALQSGGFLALETNGGEQAEAIYDLLCRMRVFENTGILVSCFRDIRKVKDFAGITRFVTAIRC